MNHEAKTCPIRSVRWEGRTRVVEVVGDVTLDCVVPLQRRLLALVAEEPRRIVVDLGGVKFMDSSGIASLVKLLSAARKGGIELRLAALDERVRGVFEVTRLSSVFDIRDTVEEAMG